VSLVDPDCYEAEQYRKLRYVLEEKRGAGRGFVAAVCSPAAGDGKSLTATNLAASLAQAPNVKVLLMDIDLRRESASLKSNLHIPKLDGLGVTDAIQRTDIELQDIARPLAGSNVSVVFTGTHTATPYEILRSTRFDELLAAAGRQYDYVILDAPPVVPVSDCRVIANRVDGLLMVVAAHRTPRSMLEEALDLLGPDKLLGIIFNGSDLMPRRYYGYYGYAMPTAAKRARRKSMPRGIASRHGCGTDVPPTKLTR
jgi:capsular exopolysaccharide synthesis family protein